MNVIMTKIKTEHALTTILIIRPNDFMYKEW
jgi:hypothetical protein